MRPLPLPTTDLSGKTIIVTGANVGLGKEAARHFVRMGAETVILACRSTDKGEAAKKDIEATTGKAGVAEVWHLDLGSHASVNEFAQRVQKLRRLDVVVENAGIAIPTYHKVEGFESTIAINVVATFLLAVLLLPKLRNTASEFNTTPRLCILASDAHFNVGDSGSRPGSCWLTKPPGQIP
jgi:retinol dehydrogenase 12